ncbi:2-oxoacid:ferredoxin oxidoreductase subunit beta [Natranaerobius thermophilus]|uniref:Pyruvate ferredoxin/flavodoxin oxidoreductase, beta subunit n=1 Tax=Natranaerobius thermophilus (strain ATCC BAA-1301 / DSM 18059 / JW/NM-WN-LF) TaxID=457570 RepID=B2A5Q9_NATTJ|nr:2-oxoacid:ferredoxin oxidoreductase subunit beta [Natranaerobius thermophilus]ACB84007.1 pyruvate ferredoxin/flavodoxin oxidoreductase, beta subunit [Natranaerobius thermophilus JW/NM-WN-LF]
MTGTLDFELERKTSWCPGCGNFPIRKALVQALEELNLAPDKVLVVSGIGQAAKMPHYLNVNGFNGLHGRALPSAVAAKVANPDLQVILVSGDGDSYGEGGNHFLHNLRRNPNIAHFVHNNQIYGLTKGQASPTSELGMVTGIQTSGVINEPLKPLSMAISHDAGFVARGFSGKQDHLKELMKQAIKYPGYGLVDILQPCVSFNKLNTFAWYNNRVSQLEDHDPMDKTSAIQKAEEWGDEIPIGVFYKSQRPPFEEQLPGLKKGNLVKNRIVNPEDMAYLQEEFK